MDLNKFFKFLNMYCIIDITIIIIYDVLAYFIHNMNMPDNFYPYITDDINNPLRNGNSSDNWAIILVFVFLLIIATIWISNRFDLTILKLITSYLSAISLTCLISVVLQRLIARPRPDTIAKCGKIENCKSVLSKSDYIDQFMSLPSCSSAYTMTGGIFTSLFFEDIWTSSSMFSVFFKFMPICVPLIVGSDEITRRYSRIDDVIMGYVIGLIVGYITYKSFIKSCDFGGKLTKRYHLNHDMLLINQ